MSKIQPEKLLHFFESTYDIQFMDTMTDKPALEVLQEESGHRRAKNRTLTFGLQNKLKRQS